MKYDELPKALVMQIGGNVPNLSVQQIRALAGQSCLPILAASFGEQRYR